LSSNFTFTVTRYVLWWNYDNNGDFLAAATAPSPAGPFTLQNKVINITKGQSGDFALFVDSDGIFPFVLSCFLLYLL
jgi:hypothetical protein